MTAPTGTGKGGHFEASAVVELERPYVLLLRLSHAEHTSLAAGATAGGALMWSAPQGSVYLAPGVEALP